MTCEINTNVNRSTFANRMLDKAITERKTGGFLKITSELLKPKAQPQPAEESFAPPQTKEPAAVK